MWYAAAAASDENDNNDDNRGQRMRSINNEPLSGPSSLHLQVACCAHIIRREREGHWHAGSRVLVKQLLGLEADMIERFVSVCCRCLVFGQFSRFSCFCFAGVQVLFFDSRNSALREQGDQLFSHAL
jgi:hypothetical protein